MVGEIESLPHPVKLDRTRLHLWPDPAGMQHSEVDALRDKYPSWIPLSWRISWREKLRWAAAAPGAPHHPSVLDRFGHDTVIDCQKVAPYRPPVLARDERYAAFYAGALAAGV
jgi:hypothetical protein